MVKLTKEQIDAVVRERDEWKRSTTDLSFQGWLERELGPNPELPPIFEDNGRWFRRTGIVLPLSGYTGWFLQGTGSCPVGDQYAVEYYGGCDKSIRERLELLPQIVAGQKWKSEWSRRVYEVGKVSASHVGYRYAGDAPTIPLAYATMEIWYATFTLLPTCPGCGEQYDPDDEQVQRDGGHCPPRPNEKWLAEQGYELAEGKPRVASIGDAICMANSNGINSACQLQTYGSFSGRRWILRKIETWPDTLPDKFEIGDVVAPMHTQNITLLIVKRCGYTLHLADGTCIDEADIADCFRLVRKGGKA